VPNRFHLGNVFSSSITLEASVTKGQNEKSQQKVERIFLTFQETQEFLGVSHQTLYKLMSEGLPSHKIGKKRVFLKDDLIRWIKEH
jgi:excisionase family DNA binding protein